MATDKQNNSIKNQDYKAILAYILVLVRDIYDGVVPERIKNRRNICQQKMSDVELIALTICGELLGVDSEHAWFNFAKKNLSGLFVSFCDRSRYNRTKKNLSDVIKLIFEEILTRLPKSDVGIIDSFPLPVCKFGRARFHKTFKGYSADYSYCASKKEYYYGYKVHLIVDEQGFPRGFGLTGASVDDRLMVDELLENMRLCFLIGDKGYIGLKTNRTNLIALERKNCKNPKLSDLGRQQIFKIRRRVETTISQLSDTLNFQKVLAKSFFGLCARLLFKILAFTIAVYINFINNEQKLLHVKNLFY